MASRGTDDPGEADRTVVTPVPGHLNVTNPTQEATPASARPPVPPAPGGDDILPADVGYKLLRRIGAGAFGEVFEALAPGGFRVAVKRILRAADHPSSRSEVEALEAMKAMSHPFLVQTHAYWVFQDRLVIVMELADGSLAGETARHKAEGRMGVPPEELVPIFEQAAEALDYLHSRRVTHRDVKPENLLLLKGYAKVADFGLAREHRHDETTVASEVGTPIYMAPEVWGRNVNLHSDQYSLASTYVSARLGRPIFAAKTLFDLCYAHVNETPNLDPLPPAEQQVLLKALAKRPERRYPNCAAFAKALGNAVFPPPVVVRRRTALWFGIVLACGAGGGLIAKFTRPPDPLPDPPPAPPPPAPPPPTLWRPRNWTPDESAGTIPLAGNRALHKRLTRTVGGEKLVAILIMPVADRPTPDPPPFYMLRDKVTNCVFKAAWDAAGAEKNSLLTVFRDSFQDSPQEEKQYLPGVWMHDPADRMRERTTFDATPALEVTAAEAIVIADYLGGRLPTRAQWLKATGVNENDDAGRPGPAGGDQKDGEILARRPLALGLPEGLPWPVTPTTVDVSVHGIHQLVSNGLEWADTPKPTNLTTDRDGDLSLPVTGTEYQSENVLTFSRIRRPGVRECNWRSTNDQVGFRIVLTPQ